RTCGRPGCHCHQGQKHGPHLYVSFRGPEGRTQGYYVPQAVGAAVRSGVAAWQELQAVVRELAELNRQRLWASRGSRTGAGRPQRRGNGSARIRPAKRLRSPAARRRQTVGPRLAPDRRGPRR
ncbi:MAG: DUF6788 family protein, partial [Gemmatimonadales bacterium]